MGPPRRTKFPKKKKSTPRVQPDNSDAPFDFNSIGMSGVDAPECDEVIFRAAVHSLSSNPELVRIRDEAKQRLGVAAAGETLKDFIMMNTQRVDLDPWANNPGTCAYSTGSADPLTYDIIVPFMRLHPGSAQPHLVLVESKAIIPMYHGGVIMMRGVWKYMGLLPEPGLKDGEWVSAVTGRFTTPFTRGAAGDFEEGSSTGPNWAPPGVPKVKLG
ncbi:hypothetical protein BV25DRAFT_1833704 [Artomyces pyxidatus]|uniref:Uncharacterized protein n=1 Tax=Artomyces pyxidatus TaxID=48021 RepID=A0ACB8SDN4_9AGAM|nr:hypothetical protein BV25DRAFT_1833704 [Artomyces pyxidatus]